MNCQAVAEAEKNMVFAARLTQRGHQIATMDDLMALYEKSFSENTVAAISGLPHPTVQKFAVYRCCCGGKQAVPFADHAPSTRSKVYERIFTVQQLYGAGGFCRTL